MLTAPRGTAGFSLIEVLIAMGVIGLMIMPMVTAYRFSLQSLRYSQNRQQATMLAKECLARLRATVPFEDLPTTGGSVRCDGSSGAGPYSFGSPNERIEYETQITEVSTSGGPAMRSIRVRVRFPSPFQDTKSCLESSDCNQWDFTTLVAQR